MKVWMVVEEKRDFTIPSSSYKEIVGLYALKCDAYAAYLDAIDGINKYCNPLHDYGKESPTSGFVLWSVDVKYGLSHRQYRVYMLEQEVHGAKGSVDGPPEEEEMRMDQP